MLDNNFLILLKLNDYDEIVRGEVNFNHVCDFFFHTSSAMLKNGVTTQWLL